MSTTVLGVFPLLEDVERVLAQLVGSTLDRDTIRVLHKDPAMQCAMSNAAGLPENRTVVAGLWAGAVLGGAAGFLAGMTPILPFAQAGPFFLAALGLVLGAAVGAAVSAMADALPVPPEQLPELVEIVDRGATVVLVRTESLPTARAIRDLFRANGSEVLAPVEGEEEDAIEEVTTSPEAADEPLPSLAPDSTDSLTDELAPAVPKAHAPFVPPWRRLRSGVRTTEGAEAALQQEPQ
jgi:uncharacterized membrane protein